MKKNLTILLTVLLLIPLIAGCTAKEDKVELNVLDIKAIHTIIKRDFEEDYLPDTSLTLEELVELTEVDKDSIEEFVAEVSANPNTVDQFIAVNAKKDTSYDAAQKFLSYKAKLEDEALKHADSLAKIKASKVVRKGDSVFFIMIGKPNNITDQESEEAIAFSENQVKRAEVIINQECGG